MRGLVVTAYYVVLMQKVLLCNGIGLLFYMGLELSRKLENFCQKCWEILTISCHKNLNFSTSEKTSLLRMLKPFKLDTVPTKCEIKTAE